MLFILSDFIPQNIFIKLEKECQDYSYDSYILFIFKNMISYNIPNKDCIRYIQLVYKYKIQLSPIYNDKNFSQVYNEYLYKNYFGITKRRILKKYKIVDLNDLDLQWKQIIMAIMIITFYDDEARRELNRKSGFSHQKYLREKAYLMKRNNNDKDKVLEYYYTKRRESYARTSEKERAKKKARMRWAKFESKFTKQQLAYNNAQAKKKSRAKRYIELCEKRKYSTLTNAEETRFQYLAKVFKFKTPEITTYIPQHIRLKEYKPLERNNSMANLVKKSMQILKRKIALGTSKEEKEKQKSFNLIVYDQKLKNNITNNDTIITANKITNNNKLSLSTKKMFTLNKTEQKKYQTIQITPLYNSYNNDFNVIKHNVKMDKYKPTSADEFIYKLQQQEQLKQKNNKIEFTQKKKQDIILANKDIKILDIDIQFRTYYDWSNIYQVKILTPCDLFLEISEYEWAYNLQHDINFIPLNMINNSYKDFSQKELRLNLINLDIMQNATEQEKKILQTTYIETQFIKKQLKKA